MTFAHANIVTVFDVGHGRRVLHRDGAHPREDLRAVVRDEALASDGVPLEHALAVGIEVAGRARLRARQEGPPGNPLRVVHRDVPPQNVVVTFTGDVKVVDFGIAGASSEGRALCLAGGHADGAPCAVPSTPGRGAPRHAREPPTPRRGAPGPAR